MRAGLGASRDLVAAVIPWLPQSDFPLFSSPFPEVRGPGHPTGAQSRPRAAADCAGASAGPCDSRGGFLPHSFSATIWGSSWAGNGESSALPEGGSGATQELGRLEPSGLGFGCDYGLHTRSWIVPLLTPGRSRPRFC
jgi:hypothetical protein